MREPEGTGDLGAYTSIGREYRAEQLAKVDPEQSCVRVHSALPNGTVPVHYVALSATEDGGVALPFVNLDGTLFLREIGGELIAMQFVHRIEGLPDTEPAQSGD